MFKLKQRALGLALGSGMLGAVSFAGGPVPGANPQTTSGPLGSFLPMIILVLVLGFFFLMQKRRSKQMNQMVSALSEGDEVVLSNGFMAKVVKIADQAVVLEIADGVQVKAQRNVILQALPKGTLESI